MVIVLDAGHVINPHAAAEQAEGSVVWEMSHAWLGGLELENGQFTNTNFDTYNMMRLNQAPLVETYFASSGGKKMGWSWRTGRSACPARRRQCDLVRDRQTHPVDAVRQSQSELGVIFPPAGAKRKAGIARSLPFEHLDAEFHVTPGSAAGFVIRQQHCRAFGHQAEGRR